MQQKIEIIKKNQREILKLKNTVNEMKKKCNRELQQQSQSRRRKSSNVNTDLLTFYSVREEKRSKNEKE